MQHATIKESISISGIGIHSGHTVNVRLIPVPENSGITFFRSDISLTIPVHPNAIQQAANRATYLGTTEAGIQTPEHLLASCLGLGITNLRIELDGPEVPILDGSAKPWVDLLSTIVTAQSGTVQPIKIKTPHQLSHGNARILVLPASDFRISYFLSYPGTVMDNQAVSVQITSDTFTHEIAAARTFGLKSELDALLKANLSKGVSLENVLGVDENGYMSELRLVNEPARHKILDILGDFAILGRPIQGHIVGIGSGHQLNLMMVKEIFKIQA